MKIASTIVKVVSFFIPLLYSSASLLAALLAVLYDTYTVESQCVQQLRYFSVPVIPFFSERNGNENGITASREKELEWNHLFLFGQNKRNWNGIKKESPIKYLRLLLMGGQYVFFFGGGSHPFLSCIDASQKFCEPRAFLCAQMQFWPFCLEGKPGEQSTASKL